MTHSDTWLPGDMVIPFSTFEPLIEGFKNALAKAGITISPGGGLEKLCDLTLRLMRGTLSQSERQSTEVS